MQGPSDIVHLRRQTGILGAIVLGLGSILGAGVFVSLSYAAALCGPAATLAIVVGAALAFCNGMSSAQLAASHPMSGGTYEYGYRFLSPALGFSAGWLFLCAKSASAATVAHGLAAYLLALADLAASPLRTALALALIAGLAALVLGGVRKTNVFNAMIVTTGIASLLILCALALPSALERGRENLSPFFSSSEQPVVAFLRSCALLFVAYTGYGRVATLGEEIREPRKNIPRAILLTVVVSMALYLAVGTVAMATIGPQELALAGRETVAPLEAVADALGLPLAAGIVVVGAVAALSGVLINLVLGLSRVALAMGRRGDLPARFGRLDSARTSPRAAVILVAAIIGTLALVGNAAATWSLSAFTVLGYYALTNLAALRLSARERIYPRAFSVAGLLGCLSLAFFVEWRALATGLGLLAVGLVWHFVRQRPSGGGSVASGASNPEPQPDSQGDEQLS